MRRLKPPWTPLAKARFTSSPSPCNLDEILSLADRALSQTQLEVENHQLKSALHRKYQFDNIVGQSEPILERA